MLAELHQLSQSLDRFGLAPPQVHPWVKPLSKGPFLIPNLNQSAAVITVEVRDETDSAAILKIQKDNFNAFPIFKLAFPLLAIDPQADVRRELKGNALNNVTRANLIRQAIPHPLAASVDKSAKNLAQFLRFSAEVRALLGDALPECPAVARLIETLLQPGAIQPQQFLHGITQALLAAIERGENAKRAQLVLIGEVNKKEAIDAGEIPLLLDVYREPGDDFIRIAHPKTGVFYSSALLRRKPEQPDGVCSITGQFTTLERDNLPSPKLPSLANTIIFSAFDQIPCLSRYNLIGPAIFPIGRAIAQKLNNTALWVTDPVRKGKTWSLIPQTHDSGRDLVLAYVDLHPDLDAEIAALLSESDSTEREGAFEAKAATLITAIDRLRGKLSTGAILHSFVLSRISKGQVQVELTRQISVERLAGALREWAAAAENVPLCRVGILASEPPFRWLKPRTLFPAQVIEATKWIWIRGGSERQPASGVPLSAVYDLFLGQAAASEIAAHTIIGHLLQKSTPLLLRTADRLTPAKTVQKPNIPSLYSAVDAFSLLGVALFKLNRKKETYMSQPAFQLGRMLALADTLHAQYCQVVRGGDLPPQLLGNQHYSMATENPQRALAVLAERLRIYQGWAQTARANGELQSPVRLARWAVSEMGSLAAELHGNLPAQFKDADRAEMMLGYLAREKKTEGANA